MTRCLAGGINLYACLYTVYSYSMGPVITQLIYALTQTLKAIVVAALVMGSRFKVGYRITMVLGLQLTEFPTLYLYLQLFISIGFHPSIHLSICPSIYRPMSISTSFHPSIFDSFFLKFNSFLWSPFYLSFFLFFYLSFYLFIHLSFILWFYLSILLSIFLMVPGWLSLSYKTGLHKWKIKDNRT